MANCATHAINANKRYGKSDNSVLATTQEQLPPVDRHPNSCGPPKTFSQVRGNSFRSRSTVDCLIFVEQLIVCEELLLLGPRHFNVIDVVMVPENFGITNNIIKPDNNWFRKMITFAITTDVSMKTLIVVRGLVANFFKQSTRSAALNCQGRQSHTAN